jgi:hypothetical protein
MNLKQFAALPNKAAMVAALKEINKGIKQRSKKIHITGRIGQLTARYRAYLEEQGSPANVSIAVRSVNSFS